MDIEKHGKHPVDEETYRKGRNSTRSTPPPWILRTGTDITFFIVLCQIPLETDVLSCLNLKTQQEHTLAVFWIALPLEGKTEHIINIMPSQVHLKSLSH